MKNALISLTLIALLLLVFGGFIWIDIVSAQSGGGYDLSWSTVDGGGHTWSTGNGYSLGGAIGQPDAQPPVIGSGYSLQGGFFHPHCTPAAVFINIVCDGIQARLTWTPDAANMAYDIYRFTSPYLDSVLAYKVGTDNDGNWPDPMPYTCADSATNYYYQVRSTCIGAHADANDCAEFDFTLTPGSSAMAANQPEAPVETVITNDQPLALLKTPIEEERDAALHLPIIQAR